MRRSDVGVLSVGLAVAVGGVCTACDRAPEAVPMTPVASFAPFQRMQLEVGGAAQPIPVFAYDSLGQLLSRVAFAARAEDTSVVRVEAGVAYPRALGRTRIRVWAGGKTTTIGVDVVAPVARDTVRMAQGEERRWTLDPGLYLVSAQPLDSTAAESGTEMFVLGTRCIPERGHRETLRCIVYAGERAVAVARATRATEAVVRIDRIPGTVRERPRAAAAPQ